MMFLIFVVVGLFFSVKAGNFNLRIKNGEFKYDNNVINNETTEPLNICFQQSCNIISNGKFSNDPFPISGKNNEIFSNVTIFGMCNNDSFQFYQSEFSTNIQILIFKNLKCDTTLQLNVTVECQEGFLSPDCSEIDICIKLPTEMCKNQGNCTQTKLKVSCKCPNDFTGPFCENKIDKCANDLCQNNSTCTSSNNINYTCSCPPGFVGNFCQTDVNECSMNESICSHLPNSTCINTYGSYRCVYMEQCQAMTSTTASLTTSMLYTTSETPFSIKWPLPDLATLLLVALEGAIIFILVLVLIFVQIKHCPMKNKKSKFSVDDAYLYHKPSDTKKKVFEFDSNYVRSPIIPNEKHQSMVPMFDIHELENTFSNNLSSNTPGMSTFGRR